MRFLFLSQWTGNNLSRKKLSVICLLLFMLWIVAMLLSSTYRPSSGLLPSEELTATDRAVDCYRAASPLLSCQTSCYYLGKSSFGKSFWVVKFHAFTSDAEELILCVLWWNLAYRAVFMGILAYMENGYSQLDTVKLHLWTHVSACERYLYCRFWTLPLIFLCFVINGL